MVEGFQMWIQGILGFMKLKILFDVLWATQLGIIVGMLPGDFRTFRPEQMEAIRDLGFTGFGFHLDGEEVFGITVQQCTAYRHFMAGQGLDLAQFAITYGECLFHPDPAQRERVSAKIRRGTEIAAQLEAQAFLLRPGSLNPDGPWTPHRDNHRPEHVQTLVDTLRPLAGKAEQEGDSMG